MFGDTDDSDGAEIAVRSIGDGLRIWVACFDETDQRYGGAFDRIVIVGAGGDDTLIVGAGGDDMLIVGDGPDTMDGAAGADEIDGRDGDDALTGGDGLDIVEGGADDNAYSWLVGSSEDQFIEQSFAGDEDSLTIRGKAGVDQITLLPTRVVRPY